MLIAISIEGKSQKNGYAYAYSISTTYKQLALTGSIDISDFQDCKGNENQLQTPFECMQDEVMKSLKRYASFPLSIRSSDFQKPTLKNCVRGWQSEGKEIFQTIEDAYTEQDKLKDVYLKMGYSIVVLSVYR